LKKPKLWECIKMNQPSQSIKEKLPLKQTQEKNLRAYYFITRPLNISIKDEGLIRTLAFDLDSALVKTSGLNKEGFAIKYVGNEEIQHLLEFIYQGGGERITPEIEKVVEPLTKPEMSKQQFILNLMLVADEFLVGEKSKKLKELLKSIKVGVNKSKK